MEKILVTGVGGFIGRPLTEKLAAKGYEVHITSTTGDLSIKGAATHKVDLLNPQETEKLFNNVKPYGLIHLSWEVTGGTFRTSDKNIDWLNNSLNILRFFTQNGGKKIVFSGSCSEYSAEQGLLSETSDITKSPCLYGASKAAFGLMASKYAKLNNLSYRHARLFTVYGVGEIKLTSAIPMCIFNLLNNMPFICRSPYSVWDYIYIDDAVDALIALYEAQKDGVFNIASGEPAVMHDIFRIIGELTGKTELLKFEENTDIRTMLADTENMKNNLKFIPKININDGLSKTVEWWKNRLSL